MSSSSWEQVSKAKQAARSALIPAAWRLPPTFAPGPDVTHVPAQCGILTKAELDVTETAAPQLVKLMLERELTSEAVTVAFCKRAAVAQQVANCLTEIFFDAAIARAREIDAEYAATGKPAGPLHGLPVSLKDQMQVTGYDSTIGFVSNCNSPAETESDMTTIMRNAGAVLYCKTNVPTGMLMSETYNNVWGYTPNPRNTALGAGGSSGGEAVLLAMRGSPLGVGSDIAGSIRMPCVINGLYGLKPAAGRFPTLGIKGGTSGQEAVRGVLGPMGHDLESLEMWSKAVLASRPWERDAWCYEIPWRDNVEIPKKLCFGMVFDDGMVKPTPPILRALHETKAALEAAGHTVIPFTPYDVPAGQKIQWRLILADGGAGMRANVKNGPNPEPWPQQLDYYERYYNKNAADPPKVSRLWELTAQRTAYLHAFLQHITASREVTGTGRPFDGIISPVTAMPAAERYQFRHVMYCGIWNLVDMTSVSFPCGTARRSDVVTQMPKARNDDEKEIWARYDPAVMDGMPMGLQIITSRHTEEKGLKLARIIVDARQAVGAGQEAPKSRM